MGCDIHLHVELQNEGGDWVHYAAPDLGRDYELFGKMAGVRGDDPIVQQKGLPSDLSLVTRIAHKRWGQDAHSASWLSSKEIMVLEDWLHSRHTDLDFDIFQCCLFGHSFAAFKRYDDYEYLPKPFTDVRFVFWFDS